MIHPTRKVYIGPVTKLLPNQIIVFGSNTQGRHGKGIALWARENAGAVYGNPTGLQNRSYAIITKNIDKVRPHPSISPEFIISQIKTLYKVADLMSNNEFLIPYTTTTNLNSYTPIEMAEMFYKASDKGYIPQNIIFEVKFLPLVNQF